MFNVSGGQFGPTKRFVGESLFMVLMRDDRLQLCDRNKTRYRGG